jgi:transposase
MDQYCDKVQIKIFYLKLRSKGLSVDEASNLVGITKHLGYNIERRLYFESLESIFPKKTGGHGTKLDNDQLKELNDSLEKRDYWTINEVLDLVENKFNIVYSYEGIKKLLNNYFSHVEIISYYDKKSKEEPSISEHFKESELDNSEIQKLIELIKDEKNPETIKKLFYLIFKFFNISTKLASEILSIATATGNKWSKKWKEEFYDGLIHKPGQGRKPKLTDDDLIILKKN